MHVCNGLYRGHHNRDAMANDLSAAEFRRWALTTGTTTSQMQLPSSDRHRSTSSSLGFPSKSTRSRWHPDPSNTSSKFLMMLCPCFVLTIKASWSLSSSIILPTCCNTPQGLHAPKQHPGPRNHGGEKQVLRHAARPTRLSGPAACGKHAAEASA